MNIVDKLIAIQNGTYIYTDEEVKEAIMVEIKALEATTKAVSSRAAEHILNNEENKKEGTSANRYAALLLEAINTLKDVTQFYNEKQDNIAHKLLVMDDDFNDLYFYTVKEAEHRYWELVYREDRIMETY